MREHGLDPSRQTRETEDEWVAHVNELGGQTLLPRADSWYMGANVPGKPRICLLYVGGAPAYRAICDDVVANGYAGSPWTAPPSPSPEPRTTFRGESRCQSIGNQVAYLNYVNSSQVAAAISQQVVNSISAAGIIYTLTVNVGDRNDEVFGGYRASLLVGSLEVAFDQNGVTPVSGFLASTVTYTTLQQISGRCSQSSLDFPALSRQTQQAESTKLISIAFRLTPIYRHARACVTGGLVAARIDGLRRCQRRRCVRQNAG